MNPKFQFEIVNGKPVEYKKVVVHDFFVDEEDVDIFAAEKLWQWETSEAGKWIMEHAVEQPEWHKYENPNLFGARVFIVAKLADKDLTFWQLKWGST